MGQNITIREKRRSKKAEILEKHVEFQLAKEWIENKNEKARNRLILAYRPLALSQAKQLARQSSMSVEDLAQEAFLALAESTDKFDPSLGNRFGTFARWHILGQLRRHIMDFHGPCRVGTNLSDKKVFTQFRKVRAEIENRDKKTLDDAGRDEIARRIGVPRNIIDRMEPRIIAGDSSLDAPISNGEEGTVTRGDILIDDSPNPEEQVLKQKDYQKITGIVQELLADLPDRERKIIESRLIDDDRIQLSDLGEEFGISKERVRQLERTAIRKLRAGLEEMGYNQDSLAFA